MARMHLSVASIALCVVVTQCALRGTGNGAKPSTSMLSTEEVEASLRESLEAWLHGGSGAVAKRLSVIEASTWRTYQALPKNELGRLAPRAVRYLVHNYFAKEHGWLISGLEPHSMRPNATEVHEARVLQEKAPALVEALLEARQSDRGLLLGDVVTMIAALEHLIFDESITLLEASYYLNGESSAEPLDEESLHEVLRSYLLVFEAGDRRNLANVTRHQAVKARAARVSGRWQELVEFEHDAVLNFGYARQHQLNPFVSQRYSFEDSSQIVGSLAQAYGKWQDKECREMKAHLMGLSQEGSGRVPLGTFYSQPEDATYQFTESADYLRNAGALDETDPSGPQVLVANYVTGPSNCIASSAYYSVCCINECEGLMNELEEKIQGPVATPEMLVSVVEQLSSSSVDAPRQLPETLREKLHTVAERNNGEVPLHGRLFAQWLHFAFPNECPYPLSSGSGAALTPSQWLDNKASIATPEERERHINTTNAATPTVEAMPLSQWSDDEVLPLHEPPKRNRSALRSAMGSVMQLAALCVALRTAASAWQVAARGVSGAEKEKGYMLPLHA